MRNMTENILEGVHFENYIPPTWEEWYFKIMYLVASKSKDPKTKIGAVLVKNRRIISTGYNGICRGVNDKLPERSERPEKYLWYEHGERNAIYAAARYGIDTMGTTMYTNGIPCADCARAIVQSGVSQVVVHKTYENLSANAQKSKNRDQWKGHNEASVAMFEEVGIELDVFDGFLDVDAYFDGMKYRV